MVIYGEYLFIENMITGMVLLYMTAKLANCHLIRWRLLMAGMASGFSSFYMLAGEPDFWQVCGFGGFLADGVGIIIGNVIGIIIGIIIRFAMALAITATAFGREALVKRSAIFLLITFLSGSVAMAMFNWQGVPAASGNGYIYMEALTYGKLTVISVPAIAVGAAMVLLIRHQKRARLTDVEVTLELEGRKYFLRGFTDTGNSLREPVSGRAVVLIDSKGAKKIGISPESLEVRFPERFTVIPYEAVGTKRGLLKGIRVDKISFDGRDAEEIILAFYDGSFEEYEVLLNKSCLEGRPSDDQNVC